MRSWLSRLFLLLSAISLGSCGGSGGSTSTGAVSITPAYAVSFPVAIDPAVPTPARSLIASLVTPEGQFAAGSSVQVAPLAAGDETMVLASDANSDIILASLVEPGGGAINLGATSTALAMARLSLGQLPSGSTGLTINAAIQSAAEFPNTVNLVSAALTSGTVPQSSSALMQSLATVVDQALSTIPTRNFRVNAGGLANPTVTTPTPYSVLKAGYFSANVTGADANTKGVTVQNGFPIQFAAYGSRADGSNTAIPTGATTASPDGIDQVVLPATGYFTQAAPVAVPGTGNEWNLVLLQTPVSRTANGIAVAQQTLDFAFEVIPWMSAIGTTCSASIVKTVLGSTAVPSWASQQGAEAGWNGFLAQFSDSSTWTGVGSGVYTCAKSSSATLASTAANKITSALASESAASVTTELAPFLNNLKSFATAASRVTVVYKGTTFASSAFIWFSYWGYDRAVGVCETTTTSLQLVNCAASLSISPSPGSVAVGHMIAFTATALDANGAATLTPQNLIWTSSSAAASFADPTVGVATANAGPTLNPPTITATDPISGLTAQTSLFITDGYLTFAYTGATFNPQLMCQCSGKQAFVSGHLSATVSFSYFPPNYTGNQNGIYITSLMINSNNPNYPATSYNVNSSSNTCAISPATNFTFQNGQIANWSVGLVCSGGYAVTMHTSSVADQTGAYDIFQTQGTDSTGASTTYYSAASTKGAWTSQ